MKIRNCKIAVISLFLAACGYNQGVTTKSHLTPKEVSNLEVRAQNNDIKALKELQMHYDFEHMYEKSDAVQKRLFELNDPDAIVYEAMGLVSSAKRVNDKAEKRKILDQALALARKAAHMRHSQDVSQDGTVKVVEWYIAKLDNK